MFGRIKSSECASNELFFVCGSVPDQERRRYPHFFCAFKVRSRFLDTSPQFYHHKSAIALPSRCSTWSIVHWRGSLSGRQRRSFVPCRNRPPVKWSYATSTTILGATGSHSPVRSVLQRLGPPGAFPVNPGVFFNASNFFVIARRSEALNPEINLT